MFSVNDIFLMNIAYVFAIITCLGFLVSLSFRIELIIVFRMLVSRLVILWQFNCCELKNLLYIMKNKHEIKWNKMHGF